MDAKTGSLSTCISNSRGQKLLSHSISISKVARAFAMYHGIDDPEVLKSVTLAAFLHDTGKSMSEFQEYIVTQIYPTEEEGATSNVESYPKIKGRSAKEVTDLPRHHEVSWAVLSNIFRDEDKYGDMLHAVYWHHAQPTDEIGRHYETNLNIRSAMSEEDRAIVAATAKELIECFKTEYPEYSLDDISFDKKPRDITHPRFMCCEDEFLASYENARRLTILFCVCAADRKISGLSQNELDAIVTGKNPAELYASGYVNLTHTPTYLLPTNYSTPKDPDFDAARFDIQVNSAKEALKHTTSVIKAPAGFGKTRMAVLYSIMGGFPQVFIVCPRNVIARSVYKGVVRELKSLGVHRSVELYIEGDQQELYPSDEKISPFHANIVVTNVDTLLSPTFTSRHIIQFHTMMQSPVIFDENQELLSDRNAMLAATTVFFRLRSLYCRSAMTLIISATPSDTTPLWLPYGVDVCYLPNAETHYPAQHTKPYTIELTDQVPSDIKKGDIILINSISGSQATYQRTKADILVHGSFLKDDKLKRVETVSQKFGKGAKPEDKDISVVSAKMLQSSLDVSFNNMIISETSPEGFLQSIGRANRFGENDSCKIAYIVLDRDTDESGLIDKEAAAAALSGPRNIKKLWTKFLKEKLAEKSTYTLDEIYCIYNEFNRKYAAENNAALREWYKKSHEVYENFCPQIIRKVAKKKEDKPEDDTLPKTEGKITKGKFSLREIYGKFYTIMDVDGKWVKFPDAFSVGGGMFMQMMQEAASPVFSKNYNKKTLFKQLEKAGYRYGDVIKDAKRQGKGVPVLVSYTANSNESPFPVFSKHYHYELGIVNAPFIPVIKKKTVKQTASSEPEDILQQILNQNEEVQNEY